jgi:hypothetical protein
MVDCNAQKQKLIVGEMTRTLMTVHIRMHVVKESLKARNAQDATWRCARCRGGFLACIVHIYMYTYVLRNSRSAIWQKKLLSELRYQAEL